MPVLQQFPSSRLVMYAGDHLFPHIHIQLRDGRECTVTIGDLRIVGRVDRREIREELRWITEHRTELHEAWRRLNP